MRLTSEEIKNLVKALDPFIGKNTAELRLFGSRTDAQLKGGDIDLLLLINNAELKNELIMKKHWLLAEIKYFLGDQKIDLKIADDTEIKTDAFLQLIYPKSIVLNNW